MKLSSVNEQLMAIYHELLTAYGQQHWWPGDSPWEICVGAVLTQNTNWQNVEQAINNLKQAKVIEPEKIAALKQNKLASLIRPSGYFNLKSSRLKAVTEWWLPNVHNGKPNRSRSLNELRQELLRVNGIGPETADSILLYCFNMPSFVIDTYTKRIMSRHFGTAPDTTYDELRGLFMANLPADAQLFNEFHALLVCLAKKSCRKNKCQEDCPLRKHSKSLEPIAKV